MSTFLTLNYLSAASAHTKVDLTAESRIIANGFFVKWERRGKANASPLILAGIVRMGFFYCRYRAIRTRTVLTQGILAAAGLAV